LLNNLKNFLLS